MHEHHTIAVCSGTNINYFVVVLKRSPSTLSLALSSLVPMCTASKGVGSRNEVVRR